MDTQHNTTNVDTSNLVEIDFLMLSAFCRKFKDFQKALCKHSENQSGKCCKENCPLIKK